MVKQQQTFFEVWNIFNGQADKFHMGEDWDVRYFVENSIRLSFGKVIHDMYELNLEAQIKNCLTCHVHINGASI
jgi:hypothetical protein